jgi:predicted RNase H-like HicB family nuclease
MAKTDRILHVNVRQEDDGSYWAEVVEMPGCFASGHDFEELREAVLEAIALWAGEDGGDLATAPRVDQMLVSVG